MHFFARIIFYIISLILLLAAITGIVGYLAYQGSLPSLQGTKSFLQISSNVEISRDASGVPTIQSESRSDTAFALGYLHAQERFFQMDTMRRYAAGELSELFGISTLETDKTTRLFRLREQAKIALTDLTKSELLIINQYTLGVNQGLADLLVRPFEYLILLKNPLAWQKEDSLLIQYALFLYYQDVTASQERAVELLKSNLPKEWFNFLQPRGGIWDRPVSGESIKVQSPIPKTSWPEIISTGQPATTPKPLKVGERSSTVAVSSDLYATKGAAISTNIEFPLTMPNLWYRAEWKTGNKWIRGITVPGMPQMNMGSNELIAWGMASSRGDWVDRIILETNPSGTLYLTPEGWENFSIHKESIRVSRSEAAPLEIFETKWGPVIGKDSSGNLIAIKWSALEKNAANFQVLNLEYAKEIDQALTVASFSGMAQQDFLVADHKGNIGWTILGVIPDRNGYDGKTPTNWSSRVNYWEGTLDQNLYPSIRQRHSALVAANNRLVSGSDLVKIGYGRYEVGERANGLISQLNNSSEMNEIQLIESHFKPRNLFYSRWLELLNEILNSTTDVNEDLKKKYLAIKNSNNSDQLSQLASIFRENVIKNTTELYFNDFEVAFSDFNKYSAMQMVEYTTWQLMSNKPKHLLPTPWESWHALLLDLATVSIRDYGSGVIQQTNQNQIKHVMGGRFPSMDRLLSFPLFDGHSAFSSYIGPTENISSSLNFAVSPGNEKQGLISMPFSQSNHLLSPYYREPKKKHLNDEYFPFVSEEKIWKLSFSPQ